MLHANASRGEVPLQIGGVDLVLAATLGGIATMSSSLKCQSMTELMGRIAGDEPNAIIAGIQTLTIAGDKEAAMAACKAHHLPMCRVALLNALVHQWEGDEGNVVAVAGKTKASHGGLGSSSLSAS